MRGQRGVTERDVPRQMANRRPLSRGTRPASPSEVAGPLGPAATVGFVAAGAPLLAVSSLRGADGVDDTTVRFLRAELKEEEEDVQERLEREQRRRL